MAQDGVMSEERHAEELLSVLLPMHLDHYLNGGSIARPPFLGLLVYGVKCQAKALMCKTSV